MPGAAEVGGASRISLRCWRGHHPPRPSPTKGVPLPTPHPAKTGALALLTLLACAPPDQGAPTSRAPDIRTGTPESVGMSAEALDRIGPTMQALVDEDRTGGVMTLVARGGTIVHWEAHGWRLLDEDPLERNDVFRIYSMTKPVTSVAALMLVEEGRIQLDQPVSDFIPDFAELEVYDQGELRAPLRPVTIRDLFRHTSGLTYGIFGATPVDRMVVQVLNPLDMRQNGPLAHTVDLIDDLPLLADPGARWNYSLSADVLGRVIEIVSGVSLSEFLHERILGPLGMEDTDFFVSSERVDRFVAQYQPIDGVLTMIDSPLDGPFTRPPDWYSGGAGLTSTASDYLRFSQMLLNEGELDGVRILQPETVRSMTRNHLPEELGPLPPIGGSGADQGFGMGVAVSLGPPDEGTFWWSGVASTYFWIDPVEELVAFAWTQYSPYGGMPVDDVLREILADAIVESNRVSVAGTP